MGIDDPDHDIVEVKWVELEQANELMTYLPDELKISVDTKNIQAFYHFHGNV